MKSAAKKRIIVTVTSDLVSDNRVHKVCTALHEAGFDVLLTGRKIHGGPDLAPRHYKTKRFRLPVNKGFFFYACFNLRLAVFLLISKFDVLLANDLDALPASFLIAKIKSKPLVYDSHEYFTESPELVNRKFVKNIWECMERIMLPHIKYAYTVCDSIAGIYTARYGTNFRVVRNLSPMKYAQQKDNERHPESERIILYQGALNEGRGLQQAVMAMKYVEGARLIIAGDGNIKNELTKLIDKQDLGHKVEMTGRLSIEDLTELTPKATAGISIEEDIALNYHYALPNKLFDYIQAQVPLIVADLPEMAAVVKQYRIGLVISSHDPSEIAKAFKTALFDKNLREGWKKNLKIAAKELNWENEKKALLDIFQVFI